MPDFQAEARTITHMQKMYKGLENKIISLQQKTDEFAKDNQLLRKQNAEIPELQRQLDTKKSMKEQVDRLQRTIGEFEQRIAAMQLEIDTERDEKMAAIDERIRDVEEIEHKFNEVNSENIQLRQQLEQLTAETEQKTVEQAHRSNLISGAERNEIHQAYQKLVMEKDQLEQENYLLNEEVHRLLKCVPTAPRVQHSRSVSNVSSVNLDDDFGYASAKNTLELKRVKAKDRDTDNGTNQSDGRSANNLSDLQHTPDSYEQFSEYCGVIGLTVNSPQHFTINTIQTIYFVFCRCVHTEAQRSANHLEAEAGIWWRGGQTTYCRETIAAHSEEIG